MFLPVLSAMLACAASGSGPVHGPGGTMWSTEQIQPQDAERTAMPVDQKIPPGPPGSRVRSPVLDQALAANSSAALIMFLWHHPDDAFAPAARDYLRNRPMPDSPAALQADAGPNSAVVAAFDAARRAGTEAAWQGFLADYGQHPLAREVPYFR